MGFVQSAFLFALAGVAIPVIIHLIFRWQTRRVDLGTTRFLAELLRATARRRKIKRWLLLSLRLVLIALLAGLFARPYLLAQQRSGEQQLLVFLIDKSASMTLRTEGERLIDLAVERTKRIINGAGPRAEVEIAWFDTEVEPVGEGGASRDSVLFEVKPPEFPFGGTSYGAAMSWARDVCLKSSHARREVYLLTDLQRSGLDWTATADFPEGVRVHIDDLGRDSVNNVGIVRAVPSRSLVRPGEGTTVSVTLFNHGGFHLDDVPLLLTLRSGQRTLRFQDKVSLTPREAVQREFEIDSLASGLWEGTVSIDLLDDLPFDNRHYLAILSAPPQRVLIVDGTAERGAPLPETWFLEKAVRLAASDEAATESPFLPRTVMYASEGRLPSLTEADLVVLADVADMASADAAALAGFVEEGGGLLVFTGERMTLQGCRTLAAAGLAPGTIDGISRTKDLPFRWDAWDGESTLLAPFADPQHGDLRRLRFQAHTQVTPAERTRVLAEFVGGAPALTDHRLGEGRVLWFLSSCGRSWGDWVRSRLFVPVVHQMLGDLAHLTDGGPVQYHVLDGSGMASGERRVARGEELDAGRSVQRPEIIERGGRWHVFNVSPRESETDRCTPQEFAERFRFEVEETSDGTALAKAGVVERAGIEMRRDEIWPWIALLLLGVVFLEWFVSNRTTA